MKPTRRTIVLSAAAAILIISGAVYLNARPLQPPLPESQEVGTRFREDTTTGTISRQFEGFTARPGYLGPDYVGALSGRVVVLTDTVRAANDIDWSAQGLVRNETNVSARNGRVTARLFDPAHHEIGTAQGAVS